MKRGSSGLEIDEQNVLRTETEEPGCGVLKGKHLYFMIDVGVLQ